MIKIFESLFQIRKPLVKKAPRIDDENDDDVDDDDDSSDDFSNPHER